MLHCSGLKKFGILTWSMVCVVFTILTGCTSINERNTDIPKNIIAFGKRNPEAKAFVKNFNKYKDINFDMDVSEDIKNKYIPLFIQWDKRWGYKHYGKNYIGIAGCGPTCLAMVVCGLKQNPNINPYKVSSYSVDNGFYEYGKGTLWKLMTTGASHYGLHVSKGTLSSRYILTHLSVKTPMICSMSQGNFTKTGHFIVLTGIDNTGKIIINDPNSPIKSSRHWPVHVLVSQMKAIWLYSNH